MLKKITLLAATTALCSFGATSAFAAAASDNIIPAAALNGNGASSIANVIVQELNCYGGANSPLGLSNGTTSSIPDHVYLPAKPTAGNPNYSCATTSVQDLVKGQYVSTGSGGGKKSWANLNTTGIATNPFSYGSHVQFAFSDSPISATGTDSLATYNSTAAATAGAGIQVPLFVLPVAIAYSPVYGKLKTATGVTPLSFHLKYPRADGTGGLRLSRTTYCKIFTGAITNWNDAAILADNGNQSLMDPADTVARWNSIGVPIKLVGRSENSGTSNIFGRALAAQCGSTLIAGDSVYGNTGADQLPAGVKGTAVYSKTDGSLTSGTETAGLFGLADGSDGVARSIDRAPADPTVNGDVTLNGHIGYLGADWVRPSTLSGSGLHSADLQVNGTGKKFVAPTAANATAAFKGILPPQSDSKGKYTTGTPATGSLPGVRTDPLAWVFPATITVTGGTANKLAAPVAGYPLTGTTNMLAYTCYADANVRRALQNFVLFHFGKVTISDDLTKVPAKLVTSTAKGSDTLLLGILPKNGIAPLPATYATGVMNTFFLKSADAGSLNLWIQDKLQKKSSDAVVANPGCTAGVGA